MRSRYRSRRARRRTRVCFGGGLQGHEMLPRAVATNRRLAPCPPPAFLESQRCCSDLASSFSSRALARSLMMRESSVRYRNFLASSMQAGGARNFRRDSQLSSANFWKRWKSACSSDHITARHELETVAGWGDRRPLAELDHPRRALRPRLTCSSRSHRNPIQPGQFVAPGCGLSKNGAPLRGSVRGSACSLLENGCMDVLGLELGGAWLSPGAQESKALSRQKCLARLVFIAFARR